MSWTGLVGIWLKHVYECDGMAELMGHCWPSAGRFAAAPVGWGEKSG